MESKLTKMYEILKMMREILEEYEDRENPNVLKLETRLAFLRRLIDDVLSIDYWD